MSIDIENVSIVYTWVDSTDKNYMFKRKKLDFSMKIKIILIYANAILEFY